MVAVAGEASFRAREVGAELGVAADGLSLVRELVVLLLASGDPGVAAAVRAVADVSARYVRVGVTR